MASAQYIAYLVVRYNDHSTKFGAMNDGIVPLGYVEVSVYRAAYSEPGDGRTTQTYRRFASPGRRALE